MARSRIGGIQQTQNLTRIYWEDVVLGDITRLNSERPAPVSAPAASSARRDHFLIQPSESRKSTSCELVLSRCG